MELRPAQRELVGIAVAVLLVGAGAGAWEFFAAQAPYTPLRAPQLEAPVAQLRGFAVNLSLLLLAAAWLLPWVEPEHEPRLWVRAVGLGSLISLLALGTGALRSMMAVQLFDPRPDGAGLAVARAIGHGLLALCLLDFVRRALRRTRRGSSA